MNHALNTLMAIGTFSSHCQYSPPVLLKFSFKEMKFTIYCGEYGTLSVSEEKIEFGKPSMGQEFECKGEHLERLLKSKGFAEVFKPLYKAVSDEALKITKELLIAKVSTNQRFVKRYTKGLRYGKDEEVFFIHDYGIQSACRESSPFTDFITSENFIMNKLLQSLEIYSLEILMEAQFNPKEIDEILIPVFQEIESTWTSFYKYEA